MDRYKIVTVAVFTFLVLCFLLVVYLDYSLSLRKVEAYETIAKGTTQMAEENRILINQLIQMQGAQNEILLDRR